MFTALLLLALNTPGSLTPLMPSGGEGRPNISEITTLGGRAYFIANHPWWGREFWVTDGEAAVPVTDFDLYPSGPIETFVLEDRLFFYQSLGENTFGYIDAQGEAVALNTFDWSWRFVGVVDNEAYFRKDEVMVAYDADGNTRQFANPGQSDRLFYRGDQLYNLALIHYKGLQLSEITEDAVIPMDPLFEDTELFSAGNRNWAKFFLTYDEDDLYIHVYRENQDYPWEQIWRWDADASAPRLIYDHLGEEDSDHRGGSAGVVQDGLFYFRVSAGERLAIYNPDTEELIIRNDSPRFSGVLELDGLLMVYGRDGLYAYRNGILSRVFVYDHHEMNVFPIGDGAAYLVGEDYSTDVLYRTDGTAEGTQRLGSERRGWSGFDALGDVFVTGTSFELTVYKGDASQEIKVNPRPSMREQPTLDFVGSRVLSVEDGSIKILTDQGFQELPPFGPAESLPPQITPLDDGRVLLTKSNTVEAWLVDAEGVGFTRLQLPEHPRVVTSDGARFYLWLFPGDVTRQEIWRLEPDGALTLIDETERIVSHQIFTLDGRVYYGDLEDGVLTLKSATGPDDIRQERDPLVLPEGYYFPELKILSRDENLVRWNFEYGLDRQLQTSNFNVTPLGIYSSFNSRKLVFLGEEQRPFVLGNWFISAFEDDGSFTPFRSLRQNDSFDQLQPYNGEILLLDEDETLILSDGTEEGTRPVDLGEHTLRYPIIWLHSQGKSLIFDVQDRYESPRYSVNSPNLFIFDQESGLFDLLLQNISSDRIRETWTAADGTFYLTYDDPEKGTEILMTDGTPEGTQTLDIIPGSLGTHALALHAVGDDLYFAGLTPDEEWWWYRYTRAPPVPDFEVSFTSPDRGFCGRTLEAAVGELPEGAQLAWRIEGGTLIGPADQPTVSFKAGTGRHVDLFLEVTLGNSVAQAEKRIDVVCF